MVRQGRMLLGWYSGKKRGEYSWYFIQERLDREEYFWSGIHVRQERILMIYYSGETGENINDLVFM